MSQTDSSAERQDAETSLESLGVRDAAVLSDAGHRSQDALTYAGQRRINIMWEATQSLLSLSIVGTVLLMCVTEKPVPEVLKYMAASVIAWYFARTNHVNTGGVGHKPPTSAYEGR